MKTIRKDASKEQIIAELEEIISCLRANKPYILYTVFTLQDSGKSKVLTDSYRPVSKKTGVDHASAFLHTFANHLDSIQEKIDDNENESGDA